MGYQALYRQWRPTRFADFVGQEAVITTLRNQVSSGRVAHAYLFCGSRGTGKTSAAKVMARAINCLTPDQGEPCGVCEVCLRLAEENNLDVVEIDAASNNGVDEIRDLRDKVKYPPQYGQYRVYIIDEVHMLSSGAFNALLKTLEEPPPHAVFILATTEPQKLPATILSRCQRYDFHRIPAIQMVPRLREAAEKAGAQTEPAALDRIARAAEGGMRDALSILDMCLSYSDGKLDEALVLQVLGASDRDFLFRFSRALLAGDSADALSLIDQLMRGGREAQVFARDITQHLRALMLAQHCGDALSDVLEITAEDARRYAEQAATVSGARLLTMLDLFIAAEADMKWANQPRVALEMAAVRACLPQESLTKPDGAQPAAPIAVPDAVLMRIAALERAVQQGAVIKPPEVPASVSAQPTTETPPPVASKPAPKPQAASVIPGDDDVQRIWNQAMDLLKRQQPAAFAQLRNTRFIGRDGHTYQVQFAPTLEVMMKTLDQPFWRQPIEQALRDAGDPQATLLLMLESTAPSRQQAQQSQQRQEQVFDLFGREFVEVVDE